jgi:hypothetical protein
MGTTLKAYAVNDFMGGLVSDFDETQIPDNTAFDCLNVISKYGVLQKRVGYGNRLGDRANDPILLLDVFVDFNTMDKTLLRMTKRVIESYDPGTGYWTSLLATPGSLTATDDDKCTGINWLSTHWYLFTNGVDKILAYNGTGFFTTPISHLAKYMCLCSQHLVTANVTIGGTAYPSGVYCSDINDPFNWTIDPASDAYLNFLDDTPDEITGCINLGQITVITKKEAIYEMEYIGGNYKYNITKRNEPVGCIAPSSLVSTGKQIFFMGNDTDFYTFDGVNVVSISTPYVRNIIDKYFKWTYVNTIVGMIKPDINEVWFSLNDGTYNCPVLAYSYIKGTWTKHNYPRIALNSALYSFGLQLDNSWLSLNSWWMSYSVPWNRLGGNIPHVLHGTSHGGVFNETLLYRDDPKDDPTDGSYSIYSMWTSKLFDFGSPHLKELKRVQLIFETSDLYADSRITATIGTSYDGDSESIIWGDTKYSIQATSVNDYHNATYLDLPRFDVDSLGNPTMSYTNRYFCIKLEHDMIDENFKLKKLVFWYKDRGVV